jgi:DHA2 family multidrug resistance protein
VRRPPRLLYGRIAQPPVAGLIDLRGTFGLGVDEAAWLSTLATAPQIVLAPAVAWLAAAYGIRRVMVGL